LVPGYEMGLVMKFEMITLSVGHKNDFETPKGNGGTCFQMNHESEPHAHTLQIKTFATLMYSNMKSAVTYTSISSNSDGPSWGIPLMNAGELPEMDPYEKVAQQGQTHPLSHAYVPDPMELDGHVPVYVLEPEHPEYH
nr:hypothetical protein [Tanacetum cinerariifolium]